MIHPVSGQKRIVFRANRETLMLVAAATAATFVIAFTVHSHPQEAVAVPEAAQPQQDWAGHLAEVSSDQIGMASTEPMTSASLVVPKAALALPNLSTKAKPRACDSTDSCSTKAQVSQRARSARTEAARLETQRDRSLVNRLNPLNHLPDMAMLGRPFTYAGNTISGWINRL